MKETVLFSNVIDDITADVCDCSFNQNTISALKKTQSKKQNLIFINAPGFKNDNLYFKRLISCFDKIGIHFDNMIELSDSNQHSKLKSFPKENRVYFLMGGNPITQMDIIKKYNLLDILKDYEGLVIGFCAGAINLSKYSIITSDNDFATPSSYSGINRIDITIEPHYTEDDSEFTLNRKKELNTFCKELGTNIIALPDTSAIYVADSMIEILGNIYKF